MRESLFNLHDENGMLYAIEKWTWSEEMEGYKIEIRYFQGTDERSFVEAAQPNTNKKRTLIQWVV